jgi:hypothetical protein
MAGCLHHEYIEKKLNVNPTQEHQLTYHSSSQMIFLSPAAQRDVPSARRFLPDLQQVIPLLWPRWSWPAFQLATRARARVCAPTGIPVSTLSVTTVVLLDLHSVRTGVGPARLLLHGHRVGRG